MQGLEIFNSKSQMIFSSNEDRIYTLIGSIVGSGNIALKGNQFTYFHLLIHNERLEGMLQDDFTPNFNLTYNSDKTSVAVKAPDGVTTIIGYY